MLGAQETETEEDVEAQRNRNINLADLQSLLAWHNQLLVALKIEKIY